jgi:hypothetical protein
MPICYLLQPDALAADNDARAERTLYECVASSARWSGIRLCALGYPAHSGGHVLVLVRNASCAGPGARRIAEGLAQGSGSMASRGHYSRIFPCRHRGMGIQMKGIQCGGAFFTGRWPPSKKHGERSRRAVGRLISSLGLGRS